MRPLLAAVTLLIAAADKGPTPPAATEPAPITHDQCQAFAQGTHDYCMKTFAIETGNFADLPQNAIDTAQTICLASGYVAADACMKDQVLIRKDPDEAYCVDVAANMAAALKVACDKIGDDGKGKNSPKDRADFVKTCQGVAEDEMHVIFPRCMWQREFLRTGKPPPIPEGEKLDPSATPSEPEQKPELPPFKEPSTTI